MDNFQKYDENPYKDLYWNIPDGKKGSVNIIGGNKARFAAPVKIASLAKNYHFSEIKTVVPDVLKPIFNTFPNMTFLTSTDSGSLKDDTELLEVMNAHDINLIIGDLSKNAVTSRAVASAVQKTTTETLLTRDAVDTFIEGATDQSLMNENAILFCSMAQVQKLFHAVLYPKVILLSAPLNQIVDALHKFTLSYPLTIITFHAGQILVASAGKIAGVPLEKTEVPVTALWDGALALRLTNLNLFNPKKPFEASISSLFPEKMIQ